MEESGKAEAKRLVLFCRLLIKMNTDSRQANDGGYSPRGLQKVGWTPACLATTTTASVETSTSSETSIETPATMDKYAAYPHLPPEARKVLDNLVQAKEICNLVQVNLQHCCNSSSLYK